MGGEGGLADFDAVGTGQGASQQFRRVGLGIKFRKLGHGQGVVRLESATTLFGHRPGHRGTGAGMAVQEFSAKVQNPLHRLAIRDDHNSQISGVRCLGDIEPMGNQSARPPFRRRKGFLCAGSE